MKLVIRSSFIVLQIIGIATRHRRIWYDEIFYWSFSLGFKIWRSFSLFWLYSEEFITAWTWPNINLHRVYFSWVWGSKCWLKRFRKIFLCTHKHISHIVLTWTRNHCLGINNFKGSLSLFLYSRIMSFTVIMFS